MPEVRRLAEEADRQLSLIFQEGLGNNIEVYITRDREFQRFAGPLYVAFAMPSQNRIVINYSRMRSYETLQSTIKHELCHLYLHQASRGRAPRWLDEGFCQWASSGISELISFQGKERLLRAARSKTLIPLESLTRFPSQSSLIVLAYQESRDFVEYLIKKKGPEGVVRLLSLLRDGEPLEEAIRVVYGETLKGLEQEWQKTLFSPLLYVRFISEHLYEILFITGALLTVAGVCILRRRRRLIFQDEEEDDPGRYY